MSSQVQFVVELDIADLPAFKQIAAACIERVEASESTTLAYLWNISDDGTKCTILEWYADASVIPAHFALVGPILAGMGAAARIIRFQVLGDLTDEARKAIAPTGATTLGLWSGFTRFDGAPLS